MQIKPGQFFVAANHQNIFRIAFFGGLGKVEATGYDRFFIQNHNLVVGNCKIGINPHRHTRFGIDGAPDCGEMLGMEVNPEFMQQFLVNTRALAPLVARKRAPHTPAPGVQIKF